jgi:hypothetical protein
LSTHLISLTSRTNWAFYFDQYIFFIEQIHVKEVPTWSQSVWINLGVTSFWWERKRQICRWDTVRVGGRIGFLKSAFVPQLCSGGTRKTKATAVNARQLIHTACRSANSAFWYNILYPNALLRTNSHFR